MDNGVMLSAKIVAFIGGVIQVIFCVIFALVFYAGFYVVLYQVYWYLRHGVWTEMLVMYLVQYGPESFLSWINHPSSWLGLHEILSGVLSSTSLSVFLMLIGGVPMLVVRIEGRICFGVMAGFK